MKPEFISKLAIGTAQFGLDYGVSNLSGKVPPDEIDAILAIAREVGINTFDTAIAYGASERLLGKAGVRDFAVVTKLPTWTQGDQPLAAWAETHLKQSLQRLGCSSLYGLLLHDPNLLRGNTGAALFDCLSGLKENGIVQRIGWSVYTPEDLDGIPELMVPDLVQVPFNPFDRRMLSSGWLGRLHSMDVEIHVRSVFLQGLLLMQKPDRPGWTAPWKALWEEWDCYLEQHNLNPISACLANALSTGLIDKLVLGINSAAQLSELLHTDVEIPEERFSPEVCVPEELIDPRTWK